MIQEWRDVDILLRIDCSNAMMTFSRSRLIELITYRILNKKDNGFIDLISAFCNLPIYDIIGNDLSIDTGIPPVYYISEVLFNIVLTDIDHKMSERLPKLKYARYLHEIIIEIQDNEMQNKIDRVIAILKECNIGHSYELVIRGGEAEQAVLVKIGISIKKKKRRYFHSTVLERERI